MKNLMVALGMMLIVPAMAQQSNNEYYADGTLKTEYVQDGDLVAVNYYYTDGTLKESGQFLNGKRHGEWVSYSEKGIMSAKVHFDNGSKAGVWMFWDDNGELAHEVNYTTEAPSLVVHNKE